jgi:Syntaxin 6, N-terminal
MNRMTRCVDHLASESERDARKERAHGPRKCTMQDPYLAVREEVENSVRVVVELHTKWLSLDSKSDNFEWTSSELLSGLRAIEWDLQDLEDTVSIVEGNRIKFQLDEGDMHARKEFIETTRRQIVTIRNEVQGKNSARSGFSTGKPPAKGGLPSISKAKGYGKVGSDDPLPPADDSDVERGAQPSARSPRSDGADEILGAELDVGTEMPPPPGRHRQKKQCLAAFVVLLAIGGAASAAAGMGGGAAASSPVSPQLVSSPPAADLPHAPSPSSPPVRRRMVATPTASLLSARQRALHESRAWR